MLSAQSPSITDQLVLVHEVYKDDQFLINSPAAKWFGILNDFPWKDYREIGSIYYDALYHFNKSHPQQLTPDESIISEDKNQAALDLLFNRATMDESIPVLYKPEYQAVPEQIVHPNVIAPGIVPHRGGGPKPKCFFALLKSFIGISLMGFSPEPENVFLFLNSNPSFARVCGFLPKGVDESYWSKYVPSLRKLEQFDQIMRDYGLWERIKREEIIKNIEKGVIHKENKIVGDTTHYHAHSGFETLIYLDDKDNEKKKSQSKPTKNCRCENRNECHHPWELSDEGAGTIVKGGNKIIWGHKASIIGLPEQGIPLDAKCVADAATNDGRTFFPHVKAFFDDMPEIRTWFDTALYDSACDIPKLKKLFMNEFEIQLKTSMNPRGRKTIKQGLPKGMDKLTPYGTLICQGGFTMDFKGIRNDAGQFIYTAPLDKNNVYACASCAHRLNCCSCGSNNRTVSIPFKMLPHIDSNDPPMAKNFKDTMKKRPSVERMIKRLKCDLGDDRLTKRGNASFQAYLDKTMIALHILIRE